MLRIAMRNRVGCLLLGVTLLLVSARAANAAPLFVYTLDHVFGGPNQIYGFQVNPTTGALTLLPGFPKASGGTGGPQVDSEHVTFAHGRLYVVNVGSNSLSVFSVNPATGALTALPFSPIAIPDEVTCVAVHPTGSPIVVGGNVAGFGVAASFVVTATTATPAAGSPVVTSGADPFSCEFSADGNFFYTGGNFGNAIAAFSVAQSTGVLTPLAGSPFDTGAANPIGYAADASGRLFSANFASGVRVFTTSAGALSAVAGNPFTSGLTGAVQGILHPGGFYMVADRMGNQVGVYRIAGSGSATTLSAVPGSPFATAGAVTNTIATTLDGGLVIAANGATRNLTVFRVNTSTGGLTRLAVQPVNTAGTSGVLTGLAFASFSAAPGDFDGDSTSDITVYRPSSGTWFTLNSGNNFTTNTSRQWGVGTDIVVPGDYDGDGKADLAVYRPSSGTWFVGQSSTNYTTFFSIPWGASTDIPVPGDYDGDGKTDLAVYRPSTGAWFILQSSTNYTAFIMVTWGTVGDIPVARDYDGDGKTDIAVYRPSTGTWFVEQSSTNNATFFSIAWGTGGDVPVPADYDGDGKAELAIYRPSTGQWFLLYSSAGYTTFSSVSWGAGSDVPVPADYDGDGKTDPAVFRPSTGAWWILKSSTNYTTNFSESWGVGTDIPILKRP